MAALAAAQLLDELMGRDRNLAPTDKKRELRWDDGQVCKHYLVKFCPNELFINTRADLGPCDKLHDETLKREYEKSSSYQKMGYEDDFIKFCQGMMADVDRRIRRGRQRLSLGGQEGGAATPAQVQNNEDQIRILTERINGLLGQVETLGCDGKVEEAQGIMKLCDQLKDERENLRRTNENSHWMQTAEIAAAQEKQMEVCEVCGAFLIVGDAQQRVDDHLMGKQHVGFAKIKAAYEEIQDKRQKEKEERDKVREKEREERLTKRKEVDKHREEADEKRKKRDDDRRKERDRRQRTRSRSRDRRRSRSRDRKRPSRSRSRDRRGSDSRNRGHIRSYGGRDRRRSRSRSRLRAGGNNDHKRSRRSRSRSHSKDRHRNRDSERKKEREHTKKRGRESHERKSDEERRNDRSHSRDKKGHKEESKSSRSESESSSKKRVNDKVDNKEVDVKESSSVVPAASVGDTNGAVCEGDSEQ